jgi:signal transduction histidine kinase
MLLGNKRYFTGILHDITDRKLAESRALQVERLAAIGQMISVVGHESRNGLQRIIANLEMVALETSDRPEVQKYLSRAQTAHDELHHLYDELRNYAAPITLERKLCPLDELIDRVCEEVSAAHRDREIRLHPDANGCDPRCEVDPFRIRQVFRNLMDNSLAACSNALAIDVVLSETNFHGRSAVDLVYRDNGPGLNDEQRRRIFEPFFTTKTKGTGLGMAISKRIVEAHGGQIAVGENSCQGAEFLITLPRESM